MKPSNRSSPRRRGRSAATSTSAVKHIKSISNSVTSEKAQLLAVGGEARSCHSLFFGTDDINSLKTKTDGAVADVVDRPLDEPSLDAEKARDVKEIRDLAKSIFHVYFTHHDGDDDSVQIKQQNQLKTPGLLTKMNGTMPWLSSYLKDSAAIPAVAKAPILFMEACFRGIAQVSVSIVFDSKVNTMFAHPTFFYCLSKNRSSSKIIP